MISTVTLALAFTLSCITQPALGGSASGYGHIIARGNDRTMPSHGVPSCHWDPNDPLPFNDQCAAVPKAVLLHHTYSAEWPDHFYGTDEKHVNATLATLGFQKEPYAAKVYLSQEYGTVPLFRLWNAVRRKNFYTASVEERDEATRSLGFVVEKIEGYIYKDQICCSLPFYRLKNTGNGAYLYTASEKEAKHAVHKLGYQRDGMVGYILPLY